MNISNMFNESIQYEKLNVVKQYSFPLLAFFSLILAQLSSRLSFYVITMPLFKGTSPWGGAKWDQEAPFQHKCLLFCQIKVIFFCQNFSISIKKM